ncbi:MAG: hypothetical protein NVS9B7_03540 [Flavisolibacter sp.]
MPWPAITSDHRYELEEIYKRPEKEFYAGLEKILTASLLTHQYRLTLKEREKIEKILKECQFLAYAPISIPGKKEALKNSTSDIFENTV